MSVPELQAVIMPRLRGLVDGDSNAALAVLTALVLALYHQSRTGEGQFVATSMLAGNLWAYADDAVRYPGKSPLPLTDADFHGLHALYRLYQAAEGWVFLAAPRQQEWEQFVAALDRADLAADPRFATADQRAANDEALITELEQVFAHPAGRRWESMLVPQDIACVAAYDGRCRSSPAPTRCCGRPAWWPRSTTRSFGRILRHGLPVQFSETPGRLAAGCVLGQHNRAIMTEFGYSPDRMAELEEKEAVFSPTP